MSTRRPSETHSPERPRDERPRVAGGLSCRDAGELLPWLLNGSLTDGEDRRVRDHLAACASCRSELVETAEVWGMATGHVPSLALAEYAHGLAPGELDRDLVERHLAICPACREELDRIEPERVVDFATARAERAARSRRWLPGAFSATLEAHRGALAAAATVAFLLFSGATFWTLMDRDATPAQTIVAASVDPRDPVPRDPGDGRERTLRSPAEKDIFVDGFESGLTPDWVPTP